MRSLKLYVFWHIIGFVYIALIIYLSLAPISSVMPSAAGTDKVMHIAAYAIMMIWFGLIYKARRRVIVLGIAFIILGIVLEILQGLTGYRSMEVMDMIANNAGVLIGWIAIQSRLGDILTLIEKLIWGIIAYHEKKQVVKSKQL